MIENMISKLILKKRENKRKRGRKRKKRKKDIYIDLKFNCQKIHIAFQIKLPRRCALYDIDKILKYVVSLMRVLDTDLLNKISKLINQTALPILMKVKITILK